MKHKHPLMYILLLMYIIGGTLFAKEYTQTSFYAAYDANDNSQYVLVMPMVNKVYTHKAGEIKPEDLKQIDGQFQSFPSYNNGTLCFPALNSDATGDDGASVMAGKCYSINFFYTQKEFVDAGAAFILTYTRATGGDKVYEGLAGQADSFKVVRDGDVVDNNNSITGEDYSVFRFDKINAKVILGEEPGVASIQGSIVNPITGEVEGEATATLSIDVDGDGIYDGKEDVTLVSSTENGTFTFNNINIVKGITYKGQLSVEVPGYAPYQQVVTLNDGDSLSIDASAAVNKSALKEVVSLESLSPAARMNSVIAFGVKNVDGETRSYSKLMSLSEFRAQADLPLGDDTVSEFTIGTDTIPSDVKTIEVTMQAFDSTKPEDIKNFPGEFKGTGLSGTQFAAEDEVGLESAAFDMFVMKDQNGKKITLEVPVDKLSASVDLSTCTNTWTRYITDAQAEVIREWGDYDTNTTEFEVPIWSNDNRESAWKFVGVGNFYDEGTPYFKVCIPSDWGSGYLNCDSPIAFEKPVTMCINTIDQLGRAVSNVTVNGRTSTGQYAYGYTNANGFTSFELTETDINKWIFTYRGEYTGWTTMDLNVTPEYVNTEICTYEANLTVINPYTADLKVLALDIAGNPVVNAYVSVQRGWPDRYYKSKMTDENGTVHFSVKPNVDYTVNVGAGASDVNIDGNVIAPETADSGVYADVTVQDVNQAPYGYGWIYPSNVNNTITNSVYVSFYASDNNLNDTLTLDSLTLDGVDITLENPSIYSSIRYYSQSGDLNISNLYSGTYELVAIIKDSAGAVTRIERELVIAGNRAPVIASPLVAMNTVGDTNIAETGTIVKPDTYKFNPNVYDPDGDEVNTTVMVDGVDYNGSEISIGIGNHEVKITATDDGINTVSKTFTFTATNQKPIITQAGVSPATINLHMSGAMMLYAYVSDPDGDGVGSVVAEDQNGSSYTLTRVNDNYWSVNADARELGVGTHVLTFVATDAAEVPVSSNEYNSSVSIIDYNHPPTFYLPMSDVEVTIGTVVQMTVIGEDPENTRLTYSWSIDGQPYTGTPVDGPQLGEQRINISGLDEGIHTVSCTITDAEGASATDEAKVAVVNYVPKFIKEPVSTTADLNEDATFECEATDENGPLTYSWLVDGTVVSDATGTSLTLNYENESEHTVQCKVSDAYGKTAESRVATLTVIDPTATHPLTIHVPIQNMYVTIHDADDNFKMIETKVVDDTGTATFQVPGATVTFSLSFDPNSTMSPEELWNEELDDLILDAYNNCNYHYDEINISECQTAEWCTLAESDTTIPVWLFNAAMVKDSDGNVIQGEDLDTNKDGLISQEEIYIVADKNGDGKVTWSEIGDSSYASLFYKKLPIREYTFTFDSYDEDQVYYSDISSNVEMTPSTYLWFCQDEYENQFNVSVPDANETVNLVNVTGTGWAYYNLPDGIKDMNFSVTYYNPDTEGNYDFLFKFSNLATQEDFMYLLLDQTKSDLSDTLTIDVNELLPREEKSYTIIKDDASTSLSVSPQYKGIYMDWPSCQTDPDDENMTICSTVYDNRFSYQLSGNYYAYYNSYGISKEHQNYYGDGTLQSSYRESDYPMLDVNITVDVNTNAVAYRGTELDKVDFSFLMTEGQDTTNCDEYDCESFVIEITSVGGATDPIVLSDINLTEALPANIAAGLYEGMKRTTQFYTAVNAYESRDKTGDELVDELVNADGDYYHILYTIPNRSVYFWMNTYGDISENTVLSASSTMTSEEEEDKVIPKPSFLNPFGIKVNRAKIYDGI